MKAAGLTRKIRPTLLPALQHPGAILTLGCCPPLPPPLLLLLLAAQWTSAWNEAVEEEEEEGEGSKIRAGAGDGGGRAEKQRYKRTEWGGQREERGRGNG